MKKKKEGTLYSFIYLKYCAVFIKYFVFTHNIIAVDILYNLINVRIVAVNNVLCNRFRTVDEQCAARWNLS